MQDDERKEGPKMAPKLRLNKAQVAELKRISQNLKVLASACVHAQILRHINYAHQDIDRFLSDQTPDVRKNIDEEDEAQRNYSRAL